MRDEARIATPIGIVRIVGDEDVLFAIELTDGGSPARGSAAETVRAGEQIAAFFAGALTKFDLRLTAPVSPRGQVLRNAIASVGFGETAGYGELARRFGSGARAIGQTCARNLFPLVVPCHRVLGAGGTIGHYSAGAGVATKRWLLAHEALTRTA